VERKDSLSTLLYNLGIKPIYGKQGSLSKVIELNPWLKTYNGALIYQGQVIDYRRLAVGNIIFFNQKKHLERFLKHHFYTYRCNLLFS
jgi:hypothetical protein